MVAGSNPVTPTGKRVTANKPSSYPFLYKKERDSPAAIESSRGRKIFFDDTWQTISTYVLLIWRESPQKSLHPKRTRATSNKSVNSCQNRAATMLKSRRRAFQHMSNRGIAINNQSG